MSFNEISDFRKALERLSREYPKLINAGQRSLLFTIVSYPDGCFIGQEVLSLISGLSMPTQDTYLRRLTKLGFIDREQSFARKGVRQCYRVNVANMSAYCLSQVTPLVNPGLPITSKSKPITESATAYHPSHAYRDNKYNKYERTPINRDRWNKLLSLLPRELQEIKAGNNYEINLDALEVKNVTLEATARHLSSQNYGGAETIGGLVDTLLKAYAGSIPSTESLSVLAWCGKCKSDEDRTVEYPSYIAGGNGRRTSACPTCSKWAQLGGKIKVAEF